MGSCEHLGVYCGRHMLYYEGVYRWAWMGFCWIVLKRRFACSGCILHFSWTTIGSFWRGDREEAILIKKKRLLLTFP